MDDHVTKPVKAADLLWTVGEWTRPLEEAGLPTLDEEWLDGLAARVGKDKVVEYLAEFVEEVALVLGRCGADDRIETGRLAHRLVGSAGQLGFKALSAASRQLMLACNEPDGTSLPTAAAQRNLRLALAEGQAIISQLSAAGDATGTFAA